MRKSLNIAFLGLPGSPFGALLGSLGALLGRLGALLGRLGSLLDGLGASEGRKSEKAKNIEKTMKINDFGLLERSREASWEPLGASWRPLGPSWSGLRSFLGGLGASEKRKRENAKNIEKTNENQRFWLLGALFGGLLEVSWGVLEVSWAVLEASWGALGPSFAVLGPS